MLILDKEKALDRMIWLSGRHAVVVPELFAHDRPPSAAASSSDDQPWKWSAPIAPGLSGGRSHVLMPASPPAA